MDENFPTHSTASPPSGPTSPFVDTTPITRALRWMLIVSMVLGVISVFGDIYESRTLADLKNSVHTSDEARDSATAISDQLQSVIGISEFLLAIATALIACVWLYHTNSNSRPFSTAKMRFSPGWTIGWYFIPIANLWKPYQAMKELWLINTMPHQQTNGANVPSLLPTWWTLWILHSIIARAAGRLSLRADTIDQYTTSNLLMMAADLLWLPLCWVFLQIIVRLHAAQQSAIQAYRPAEATSEPAPENDL